MGSFGRVMLVQHKGNHNYYAMKILDKIRVRTMISVDYHVILQATETFLDITLCICQHLCHFDSIQFLRRI